MLWWLNKHKASITDEDELETWFSKPSLLTETTDKYPELKLAKIQSDSKLFEVYRNMVLMDIFRQPLKTTDIDPVGLGLEKTFENRKTITLLDLTRLLNIWTTTIEGNVYATVPLLILEYLSSINTNSNIPLYAHLHKTAGELFGGGKELEMLSRCALLWRLHT